jgi:hypothetical protein
MLGGTGSEEHSAEVNFTVPTSTRETHMHNQTANKFRRKADECRHEADKAISFEERAKYLDFARRWERCADKAEQLSVSWLTPAETEDAA